jgi:hypothetical protein
MAKFVATDYSVTVNGTDFSANLAQAELSIESNEVETTAFGTEWEAKVGGLKKGSVTLQFHQDFGASSIDATLFPLLNTIATVVILPTSASVGPTNPSYTAECLVSKYTPFASNVGDLATLSVSWPTSGTITRGTA